VGALMSRYLIVLFLFLAAASGWAQQTLRVGIAGSAPFIMEEKGAQTGFAIDLWQNVADTNHWPFEFRSYDSMKEGIEAVEKGQCDVLVGNTSITSEREKRVEFSQPFYRSGLQIMVSENRGHVARWVGNLFLPQHLEVFGFIGIAVLIATMAVTMFERRHNPDFPKTHSAGIAEAFYYVMGLITGKSTYKGFPGVLGRLMLVCWMIASLFTVSYVTSVITSSMTADIIQGHINGPQDLQNKLVGLVSGTQSEDYAKARNLDYASYPTLPAAVTDLVKGKVQALIGDSPVLQYYDLSHPEIPIHEVGAVFQPVNYGFAMPMNSPLREPINVVLLNLNEGGYFDDLGAKYFGESYQK